MTPFRFAVLFFFTFISAINCSPPASTAELFYDYEIVAEYPHDTGNFTQGLFFEDGVLYEGTGRLGQSSLAARTIDGKILKKRKLPTHLFGEGIAGLKDRIYQLTWKAGTALVWDKSTLTHIESKYYSSQGWGLTSDGRDLIMSDGSSTLYFRSPETFSIIRKLPVQSANGPVRLLNELEYIEDEIWANIWKSNRIVRIDPQTGKVTGWLDLSELAAPFTETGSEHVLNGIAYDNDSNRIFITGKNWPKLFEIRVTGGN